MDVSKNKDGGVLKEILKEGTGDAYPTQSCTVSVHYHGTLLDGTVFDSSRERNEVFKFELGVNQVIKAWDQGVASMKKGELARLTCKPEYAYGAQGSPPKIPPNATLVFEVELLDWAFEDLSPEKNNSIQRRVITSGELYSTPEDFSECRIHLRGELDGVIFDERDVTFIMGEGAAQSICKGLEIAIRKMKKGETSQFFLEGAYLEDVKLPSDAKDKKVSYSVTLHKFEKAKNCWELNSDQKFEEAEKDKAKGTEHLQAGRLEQALKYYKRVKEFMESETSLEGDEKVKRDTLLQSALLNMALVLLKQEENLDCIDHCNQVLKLNDKNVKAIFRRAQANLNINEFQTAQVDFAKCIELEPTNKAALTQLQVTKHKQKAQLEKEKKLYRSMFQKMSSGETADSEKVPEEGVWSNDQAKA